MSIHEAQVRWQRGTQPFVDGRYSRRHLLQFGSTLTVPGSASPAVVPAAYCDPDAVDPEAAFAVALASCHMLWFLSLAASEGYVVEEYQDSVSAVLGPDEQGALAITTVTLRPRVRFGVSAAPTSADFERLHGLAHARCFLARSVRSAIQVEPTLEITDPASNR